MQTAGFAEIVVCILPQYITPLPKNRKRDTDHRENFESPSFILTFYCHNPFIILSRVGVTVNFYDTQNRINARDAMYYRAILRRVRVTIVALEKQKVLHILSVCLLP